MKMSWALYEIDDRGNPIDDRVCTGWDLTPVKPVATFTDDDVVAMRAALATATGTGYGFFRTWNKLQQVSDMILEKEKKDP